MKVSNETKVGVLASLAITILILGYNFLRGKEVFTKTKDFYAVYAYTSGLEVSNPVIVNGFAIGRVGAMTLDDNGKIIVEMVVKRNFNVPKNSIAKLRSVDFFGAKAIELHYSDNIEMAEDGDTLRSEMELGLAESLNKTVEPVKMKTERMLTTADSFLSTLQKLINPQFNANIQKSLENLNVSLESIREITKNVESITVNMNNNNQKLNSIFNNLDQITDSLRRAEFVRTIKESNKVLSQLSVIATKINNGEGSMGLLINDKNLYYHLDSTAASLERLLQDINQNPKKYVSFSVFGRKQVQTK